MKNWANQWVCNKSEAKQMVNKWVKESVTEELSDLCFALMRFVPDVIVIPAYD
jgi:hypothetical protein